MSKKMLIRIVTAIVIIAVVIPPLYFGGYLLNALEAFCVVGASYETAKTVAGKTDWFGTVLNILAIAAMVMMPENTFSAVVSIWLVLLFFIEIVKGKVETSGVVYPFVITILMALTVNCLERMYSGTEWTPAVVMLYVCLACYGTDTGAYFFGSFFGKHKMIPNISPNKTWEGSIGGYALGFVLSFALGYFALQGFPLSLLLVSSAVLPLVAQVGDLSFSSIKRRFDIKDFGNLMPGHGGILDRIDSLIFCLMIFNALMLLWGVAA